MNCVSHCFSVLGPEGLRLVQVTDVSLLVDWESVRGADYYTLMYHPKDDESALEQVVSLFSPRFCEQACRIEGKSKPVFHIAPRFGFQTQRTLTSSQDCPRGSPTSSGCMLSSKKYRARQTGLKLPQVSSPRTVITTKKKQKVKP